KPARTGSAASLRGCTSHPGPMTRWLRRTRSAVVLGLIWGISWGVVGGGLMETIFDPHGQIADIWPMIFAMPGFFGGLIFSRVLAIVENRRRFDELSIPRFGAWGAVAGALLAGVALALGFGPAGPAAALGAFAVIVIPFTLCGAISASGSLALA